MSIRGAARVIAYLLISCIQAPVFAAENTPSLADSVTEFLSLTRFGVDNCRGHVEKATQNRIATSTPIPSDYAYCLSTMDALVPESAHESEENFRRRVGERFQKLNEMADRISASWLSEFDGICSAHAMVVRAKPEGVLPEFLPFLMMSDRFLNRSGDSHH